jgi:hypothetical protein
MSISRRKPSSLRRGRLLGEDAEVAVPKVNESSPLRGDYREVYSAKTGVGFRIALPCGIIPELLR